MQLLLQREEHGINTTNDLGWTTLMWAVLEGEGPLVDALLKAGANVFIESTKEWQPAGGLMMFTDSPGFINAQDGDQGPASVWFSQASNFEAFTPTCAHYLPPTAHRLHAAARPSFACIPPAACRYRLAWLPAEHLQQPIDYSCV